MIEIPRPSKEELEDIYVNRLNESAFELFKRGVTLEFLTSKLR